MTEKQTHPTAARIRTIEWIGLCLAIIGIFTAIVGDTVVDELATAICGLVFLACETISFGCSIAGGKTLPARTALIISVCTLTTGVVFFALHTSSGENRERATNTQAVRTVLQWMVRKRFFKRPSRFSVSVVATSVTSL